MNTEGNLKRSDTTLIDHRLFLFSLLFLVSGAAGLIYEIVWERLLELYFGVTMMAVTLIVAAYMMGLGLGSLLGGRIALRLRSTLAVYGGIEIGIGVFGLFSPAILTGIGERMAGSSYPLVFLLSFMLLLIPTFLMGTTLPILAQAFVDRVDRAGQIVGLLYGINTLGAALGAILAGYLLIGWIGFDGTTGLACLLNAGVGACAIVFALRSRPRRPERISAKRAELSQARWNYPTILIASFLTGFVHLGLEMLWFRVLGIVNKATAYNFPTVLSIFLIGLAIGGVLWGRKADRASDPVRLFWTIELWVGLLASVSFLIFWGALHLAPLQLWLQENFYAFQQPPSPILTIRHSAVFSGRALFVGLLRYLAPIVIMVLPASLAMGGGLPVLDRLAIHSANVSGRRVGDVHLANIAGSVVGTLAVSFLLLPVAGSELTFKVLALLCSAFLFLDLFARKPHKRGAATVFYAALLLAMVAALPIKGRFYTRLYEVGARQPAIVHESGDSVLALSLRASDRSPSRLWIGGVQNSYFPTDGRYERSILACAGAVRPKRILMIGLGGGNTAFFASKLPDVEEIVIVELLRDLAPFLSEQEAGVNTVLHDDRVHLVVDDGRRYLYAHRAEKFDLIFIDPLFSFMAGHNNLYSREAMRLYLDHLSDGGVFCGWIDEERVLPLTAAVVFSQVDYFREFLVAGDRPIRYDANYMNRAIQEYVTDMGNSVTPPVLDVIAPIRIFARFRADKVQILADAQDIPYLTDMHPRLEYYLFQMPLPPQAGTANRGSLLERVTGLDYGH